MKRLAISIQLSAVSLLLIAGCQKKSEDLAVPADPAAAMVQAPPPAAVVNKIWVENDPVQCKGNPWDNFAGIGGIVGFFGENRIKVYDTATVSYNQLYAEPVAVCQACSCPLGHALYLWIADTDAGAAARFGFKVSKVDPLNADTYAGSRRGANAAPLPSATPGPSLKKGATTLKKGGAKTSAAPAAASRKKRTTKKRRTR